MLLVFILILIISLVLIFFRKTKLIKENNLFFNFIITTLATLFGVVFAINMSVSQEEKKDLIKILKSGMSVFDKVIKYSEELIDYKDIDFKKYGFDETKHSSDLNSNLETVMIISSAIDNTQSKINSPFPEYFNTIMNDNVVLKSLNQQSLNNLTELQINLKRISYNEFYLILLKEISYTFKLEILYQKGILLDEDLIKELEELKNLTTQRFLDSEKRISSNKDTEIELVPRE
jgi:hypothetical protein